MKILKLKPGMILYMPYRFEIIVCYDYDCRGYIYIDDIPHETIKSYNQITLALSETEGYYIKAIKGE